MATKWATRASIGLIYCEEFTINLGYFGPRSSPTQDQHQQFTTTTKDDSYCYYLWALLVGIACGRCLRALPMGLAKKGHSQRGHGQKGQGQKGHGQNGHGQTGHGLLGLAPLLRLLLLLALPCGLLDCAQRPMLLSARRPAGRRVCCEAAPSCRVSGIVRGDGQRGTL